MSELPQDTTHTAQAEQQAEDEDHRGRRETRALPEEDWARNEEAERMLDALAQRPETFKGYADAEDLAPRRK